MSQRGKKNDKLFLSAYFNLFQSINLTWNWSNCKNILRRLIEDFLSFKCTFFMRFKSVYKGLHISVVNVEYEKNECVK